MAVEVIDSQATDIWQIAGTIATFLAVVVALFGPFARDWYRRPVLEVADEPQADLAAWTAGETGEMGGPLVFVGIRNIGREQASDVQVFVGIAREVSTKLGLTHLQHTYQTPVPFVHREGGHWQRQYSVAIPIGYTRPLQLVGTAEGKPVLVNALEADQKPIVIGKHKVVLDIVGANFEVTRYFGVLEIFGLSEEDQRPARAEWKPFPAKVNYEPNPFPSLRMTKPV